MKTLRSSKRAYARGVLAAAAVMACAAPLVHAGQSPFFDNITPFENGSSLASDAGFYFTPPNPTPTGRPPDNAITDTVEGDAYIVPAGTANLTGIDFFFSNATNDPSFNMSNTPWYNGGLGTTYNALKIVVNVYGTVTPTPALNASNPALSATNPAFSNLLGSATILDTTDSTPPSGYIYGFEGDGVSNPGLQFQTPIALNGATLIGVTYSIEGSTDGGVTYNFNSGLTPNLAVDSPPTVGQQQLQAFYINDDGETNGNFIQGPHAFGGVTYQGLATRLFGGSPTVYNWINTNGGSFTDTSNYNPNGTPTAIDTVQFNLSTPAVSPYTVSILSDVTAGAVNVLNDNVIFDFPAFTSQTYFVNALTVGQSNTSTGTTHGTLQLINSTNNITAVAEAGNFVVGGNGGTGTLTIGGSIYAYSDNDTSIAANSKLIIQQFGSLRTGTLTFAGTTNAWLGQLDIGYSDLIIRNGSIGTVMNQLKQGYASGHWNGSGIVSSIAAADSTHLTAVGAIVNNNGSGGQIYGNASTGTLGLFGGDNPNVNAVLVKFTYYGDANLDGVVDGSDYSRIDNGFAVHLTGWYNGDFNYDGVVDGSDYTLIDNAFNNQNSGSGVSLLSKIGSSSPTQEHLWSPTETRLDESASEYGNAGASASVTSQIATTAVPEPASLGMLGIGAAALLGRKSRRQAR